MGVASNIVAFLWLFSLLRVGSSQALPDLPDFPSASPVMSPNSSPGSLPEIPNPSPSENIKPSPSRSPSKTNSPGAVPSASMVPSSGSKPSPRVSPNASRPPQSSSQVSSSPSPSGPSSLDTNLDGACLRDEENPQPILGKSQLRYAISVLLSAGAVALASVLYGLASDWDPEEVHAVYRLIWITVARILIFGAVKVSAALVASITKASPGDSALDASGAFLTWGSATFTRLYYEGFKMTMAALEFVDNNTVWDDKLRDFLSVRRNSSRPSCLHETSANPDEGQILAQDRGFVNRLQGNLPLVQRIVGGNSERRLLLVTTIVYFASEISVLTTNVFNLVGAFMENADPDDVSFFASDEGAEPCFSSKDAPRSFFIMFQELFCSVLSLNLTATNMCLLFNFFLRFVVQPSPCLHQ